MNYYNYPQGPYGMGGGGQPPPPQWMPPPPPVWNALDPYKRPIRRNANIVCCGLLLVYLLSMFLGPLMWQVESMLELVRPDEWYSVIDESLYLLIYVLAFLVPCVVMVLWIRIPARVAFPMRRPRASIALPAIFVCLGMSVVGVMTSAFLSTLIQTVTGFEPIMPDMTAPEGTAATAVYIFSMTVAPAILEEMVFRGVIMQSLRRFGDRFALVVSSILFAMVHGNLIQGPNALLVGLVIGYFVLRTGSLLTGMFIHFVNNSLATVIDLATKNLPTEQVGIVSVAIFGIYAILGGMGLVYLLIKHTGIFRLAPSGYPLPEGRKHVLFFTSVLPIIYLIATIAVTMLYFE